MLAALGLVGTSIDDGKDVALVAVVLNGAFPRSHWVAW